MGDISRDHRRFKKIVKDNVREDLEKHIEQGSLEGQVGGEKVKVPLPKIRLPRFTFDRQQQGGVGQGEGEPGDSLGKGDPQPGQQGQGGKPGDPGDQEGDKGYEAEVSIDELADIMGDELELPNIEPKGNEALETESKRYTGIREQGPEGLKHFKRSYKEALKRSISSGDYDPDDPVIIPRKEDMRYKSPKTIMEPESNAVIIYMMDVSGSMGPEQVELSRSLSFWIDTWIRSQFDNLESRYVVHDTTAEEVDRDHFFATSSGGGTTVSSAYQKCADLIRSEYPPENWNIYTFHFSDGDNSRGDTEHCMRLLDEEIVPASRQFAYAQTSSPYGSGYLMEEFTANFNDHERVVCSELDDRSDLYDGLIDFLGKGN